MYCRDIFVSLSVILLLAVPASGQDRIRFSFDTPYITGGGGLQDYIYHMVLKAEVPSSWVVRSSDIVIAFNNDALQIIEGPLVDMDAGLASAGYTAEQVKIETLTDPDKLGITLEEPVAGGLVTKSSQVFYVGTIRFRVSNGNLPDNISFVVSGSIKTTIIHGSPTVQELQYNCGNPSCYTVIQPTPRTVFTPQCQNKFFKASDCNHRPLASSTNDPLNEGYLRWPRQLVAGGSDPHIAYYQYDLQTNAPTGDHARNFNTSQLEQIMDWGRCRWEQQCGNELQWQTTAVGGIMWWGTTDEDMLGVDNAEKALAVTSLAFQGNDYRYIVPASTCGCPEHGISEIIFNNSTRYFNTNRGNRWTTDYALCGGTTVCLDFRSVSVHELGHYIGLPHNWYDKDLMHEYGYRGVELDFQQCDADRARMLYNPLLVSTAPDNGSGCPTTDVAEQEYEVIELDLLVYPVPVYADEFTVKYTVQQPGVVTVHLLDIFGNSVQTLATERQGVGEQILQCSVKGVSNGVYYLKVEMEGMYRVQKIIIAR